MYRSKFEKHYINEFSVPVYGTLAEVKKIVFSPVACVVYHTHVPQYLHNMSALGNLSGLRLT